MTRRQWLRLLGTLPVWVILLIVTFMPSRADTCTSVRVWDKAEKAYAYVFTCDVTFGEPSPTASQPATYLSPSPSMVSASPSVEQSPTSLPTTPVPTPSPDISIPAPLPTPSDSLITPSIPEPTMLDNGVVIPVDVHEALQVLDNPVDIVAAGFKNPKKLFKAVANIGADMRPKVRKEAQSVVVSAIIVVQIAGNVATMLVRKL